MGSVRWSLAIAVAMWLSRPAVSQARPEDEGNLAIGVFLAVATFLEPLVPEFRIETPLRFTEVNWQVALPVHFAAYAKETKRAHYVLDVVAEPQFQIDNTTWRFALGSRFTHIVKDWDKGWFVEGGGVAGQDGYGGYGGVGFTFLGGNLGKLIVTALSISYRAVGTTEGVRHEFNIDLVTWHIRLPGRP